ncbi:hypothetical protein HDF22_002998 [Mucilaginibacter lappiensis]|uniref:Uncharacterized protein n=1 Tax=Mucilaginibacter lappiensis TaxID=354630 RepID=A0A841JKF6_9SPHI|nr:hypothetical protein [Mucilaginibacter lappiensis]
MILSHVYKKSNSMKFSRFSSEERESIFGLESMAKQEA